MKAKTIGSGWHFQPIRHSNARRFGRAGGKYAGYVPKSMKVDVVSSGYGKVVIPKGTKVVVASNQSSGYWVVPNNKMSKKAKALTEDIGVLLEENEIRKFGETKIFDRIKPDGTELIEVSQDSPDGKWYVQYSEIQGDDENAEMVVMLSEDFSSKSKAIKRAKELAKERKFGFVGTEATEKGMPFEHGFDLTSFRDAETFKKLLARHGLTRYRKEKQHLDNDIVSVTYDKFTWTNKDGSLKLVTGNNPITGAYGEPKRRQNEKGYASYMGISGTKPKPVNDLAKDIKETTNDIKDEDKERRSFI